ncbi:MAG: DUF2092 domain-containing protein [Pantoea sp.]|uniref:DUF2092 domain-containing protein n=1 Tax=Pantoea sp. TaxID=69393 RepID=UPI0023A24260|nr:DUF2092 domain-containing protein [Pantoea sp.]MDE1187113.1 DUF2092 domain-containing protein [Pantoea sp.]
MKASFGSRLAIPTAVMLLVTGGVMAKDRPPKEPRIEPASIEALKKMGDHLQTLQNFTIKADTTSEVVLDDEQKLEIGGEATYEVKRPDHLRIDLITDVVHGQLVYDGKTLIYASPDQKTYAQVPAPPTIKETLEKAAQRYNLQFPLADLFAWGTRDAPINIIREGFLVGHAAVDGKQTAHWAFRGPDQDAEIWIATEGSPLPLKISLVDRQENTRPRITTVLHWTENADIPADTFEYKPAEGSAKIGFVGEERKK